MKKYKLLILGLTVALSAHAFAQSSSVVTIGELAFGGNGCPQDTPPIVDVDVSGTMTIYFPKMDAHAGVQTGQRIDRKSCNLALPIELPKYSQIALAGFTYKGKTTVTGQDAKTELNASYFFAGAQGPTFTKSFSSGADQQIDFTNIITTPAWSPCGQREVIMRLNIAISAVANAKMEETFIVLNTADTSLKYFLQTRTCQ